MKDPGYEMFIAGLSILSVFNLIYELLPGTDIPDNTTNRSEGGSILPFLHWSTVM